jgi:hypothetical protein
MKKEKEKKKKEGEQEEETNFFAKKILQRNSWCQGYLCGNYLYKKK